MEVFAPKHIKARKEISKIKENYKKLCDYRIRRTFRRICISRQIQFWDDQLKTYPGVNTFGGVNNMLKDVLLIFVKSHENTPLLPEIII